MTDLAIYTGIATPASVPIATFCIPSWGFCYRFRVTSDYIRRYSSQNSATYEEMSMMLVHTALLFIASIGDLRVYTIPDTFKFFDSSLLYKRGIQDAYKETLWDRATSTSKILASPVIDKLATDLRSLATLTGYGIEINHINKEHNPALQNLADIGLSYPPKFTKEHFKLLNEGLQLV